MTEKVAVLIDNSYLRKEVIEKLPGKSANFRLGYERFSSLLCSDINLERFRTYIYDCQFKREESFFKSLNMEDSFEVRLGDLKFRDNGEITQKQVDVLIVMDMIQLSLKGKVQHIILVSADSDFIPAVKFVKEEGVKVHLRTALKDVKSELAISCDTRKPIDGTFLAEWSKKGY